MTGLSKRMAGTAFAITLSAGALAMSAAPARAEGWRDDCGANGVCVRVQCYDDGICSRTAGVGDPPLMQRVGFYDDEGTYHATYYGDRPSRYACDADGDNCHWTRSYHYDDGGTPVYDPDMTNYP